MELLNVNPSPKVDITDLNPEEKKKKKRRHLLVPLASSHHSTHLIEHKVVTVFTSAGGLLSLPVNIGQTLYRLLNHFSVSKVLY